MVCYCTFISNPTFSGHVSSLTLGHDENIYTIEIGKLWKSLPCPLDLVLKLSPVYHLSQTMARVDRQENKAHVSFGPAQKYNQFPHY